MSARTRAAPRRSIEEAVGADRVVAGDIDTAAGLVVDLLTEPGDDIRVIGGQLELGDELVVPGHPHDFEIVPLAPTTPGTIWAIDGGSCVIADGRSFQVAAFRAARVRFDDDSTTLVDAPPLEVRTTSGPLVASEARDALEELLGHAPEAIPDLPRAVDAFREWREWRLIIDTIREADAGDLVLVDGSLHGGPSVPPAVVRRAHELALHRGVALAGVVKASTLYWGRNVPLVTLLKRRGDHEVGAIAWASRISTDPVFGRLYVGDIFVAHLAPTASHAFRIDVARGDEHAHTVLGRLATAARDPAFVGYPYPLARAHQAARVSGYAVIDLRRAFRTTLGRHGLSDGDIEVLFQDFHEVLNRS